MYRSREAFCSFQEIWLKFLVASAGGVQGIDERVDTSIICKNQGLAWRHLNFRAPRVFPCEIARFHELTRAINNYIVKT